MTCGISGMIILLASCKVGPDYHPPSADTPKSWLSAKLQPDSDKKTEIEKGWWKHFNDPVLDELIDKGIAGNFDLKIAGARIEEARATREYAKEDLLPTADVKADGNRQANRIAFGNTPFDLAKPFNTFEAGFDASWELDLFGGKRRALEADTALFTAEIYSRDDARVQMLAEIARVYVDIRRYQAEIAIADDTVKSAEETVKITNERFENGSTSKLDFLQATTELMQVKSQAIAYQNLLAQSEYQLDLLLGKNPGEAHKIVSAVKPIPTGDDKLVIAAPAEVIAKRPDVRVAERKLAASTAKHGVAIAKLYPDISLSGFIGTLNTNSDKLLSATSKSWDFGGTLLWPILDYGRLSANIKAAKAEEKEALITYQKAVINALIDVERSLTAYNKENENSELVEKAVAENQNTVDIAKQRYNAGITSFTDVLDAERNLYTAQTKLADSNANKAQDFIAVYKSLGGGW